MPVKLSDVTLVTSKNRRTNLYNARVRMKPPSKASSFVLGEGKTPEAAHKNAMKTVQKLSKLLSE